MGRGADCRLLRSEGDRAIYKVDGQRIEAQVPGGGPHRALSVAAVLCVLNALGRDLGAATDLPDSLIPGGRGSERRCGEVVLVDDSYNANPASMRAALLYLRNDRGRTVAVLGRCWSLGLRVRPITGGWLRLAVTLTGLWRWVRGCGRFMRSWLSRSAGFGGRRLMMRCLRSWLGVFGLGIGCWLRGLIGCFGLGSLRIGWVPRWRLWGQEGLPLVNRGRDALAPGSPPGGEGIAN